MSGGAIASGLILGRGASRFLKKRLSDAEVILLIPPLLFIVLYLPLYIFLFPPSSFLYRFFEFGWFFEVAFLYPLLLIFFIPLAIFFYLKRQ